MIQATKKRKFSPHIEVGSADIELHSLHYIAALACAWGILTVEDLVNALDNGVVKLMAERARRETGSRDKADEGIATYLGVHTYTETEPTADQLLAGVRPRTSRRGTGDPPVAGATG